MTKAENDWFLRGGKRPEREPDTAVRVAVCQNCGGEYVPGEADECPHCGAWLAGEPSTEDYCGAENEDDETDKIEYDVSMVRTKTVRQRCRVTVAADCEESAMEKAEELAEDESDGWPWEDEDNSTEYEDCEAESAEEL